MQRPMHRRWLLSGVTALTLAAGPALADDAQRNTAPDQPVYSDSADIPAHDPSVRRPQTTDETDLHLRQAPSGPDESPGAERDSLVPIPADNDGTIDPQ